MTDEEIDAMPAGREMDLKIAKRVMAHMEPFALWQVSCPDGRIGCGVNHQDWFDANRVRIPHYSADVGAAWLVVEKLRELNQLGHLHEALDFGAVWRWLDFSAPELSFLICRGALKVAAGEQKPEYHWKTQFDCHKITTTEADEPTEKTG